MKFAPCVMLLLLLQTMACCTAAAAEGTLQRIRDTQKIRLGYFEGSAPFSFTGSDKSPQGYSIYVSMSPKASSASWGCTVFGLSGFLSD
jgi:ABC-type amino acid transport substrate-binding protein